jgi:hypothetical protein
MTRIETQIYYMLEFIKEFIESVAIEIMVYLSSVLEDLENFFRSSRFTEHDQKVMFKKDYYFDMEKGRFVEW